MSDTKLKPLSTASALRLAREFAKALESRGWKGDVSQAKKITEPSEDIILITFRRGPKTDWVG